MPVSLPVHGRGAVENPPNRFDRIDVVFDEDADIDPNELPAPRTLYLRDSARSIIATNDSPDVGMEASVNPYRGCEHGCVYCYARPTHEYFGLSAGLDFETRIFVKERAAELLRAEFMSSAWTPKVISFSGVTDCYQPVERKLQLTRRCLEVCRDFGNPCGVVTKNHLVTRDIDILRELSERNLAVAMVSITSLDATVQRTMEPRASSPSRRLQAIEKLAAEGIPVGVMIAPVVPGLTDHEVPAILHAAAAAGARFGGYVALRLPFAVKDLFQSWLRRHFPDRARKVLARIGDLRGGKLYDSAFHTRMTGQGAFAAQIEQIFRIARRRAGLHETLPPLCRECFHRPGEQMSLWPGST